MTRKKKSILFTILFFLSFIASTIIQEKSETIFLPVVFSLIPFSLFLYLTSELYNYLNNRHNSKKNIEQ